MLKPVRPLDLFLLDRFFEPCASWLFKRYNVSNFTLARWFLTLGSVGLLAGLYLLVFDPFGDSSHLTFLAGPAFLIEGLFTLQGFLSASQLERKHLKSDALPRNLRDGEYPEVRSRRLFLTLWILVMLLDLPLFLESGVLPSTSRMCQYGAWIPAIAGFMFLGCTPRHPRRDFKKSESTGRSPAVPEPSGA